MSRPLISVYSGSNGRVVGQVKFAGVMQAPVRTDVVHHVHRDISKNRRQAYAVMQGAGHQTSAESWGTGRAVARIPRVPGGGTHRAGQGAFGNMCRGGHMFAPTKTYRRWHRKVNVNQKRYAIASSLAASSSVPLVLARGHKIERVPEIPLVVSNDSINKIEKTKTAVKFLSVLNSYRDVEKVKNTKKIRAGKGKSRNRRHTLRKGPLVVYLDKHSVCRAFRNLPGVDLCCVTRLNLLQLAPGGHVGRFIIWTQAAYEKLGPLYGSYQKKSQMKFGYSLPRAIVTTSNLAKIIKSPEVLSLLRKKKRNKRYPKHRKNPLNNLLVMLKFNPYAKTTRRKELLASHPRVKAIVAAHNQRKADRRKAVAAARERRGFTPIGNVRDPKWKLPILEYLKKRNLAPTKALLAKFQRRRDARNARRSARALKNPKKDTKKKETTEESAEKIKTKEAAAPKPVEKKLYRVRPLPVGRQPIRIIRTPGKPTRGKRYEPLGLKRFRDERTRRLSVQERRAGKSLIPNIKPGQTPYVELEKPKRGPRPTRKELRARVTKMQNKRAEKNKEMKAKGIEKPKKGIRKIKPKKAPKKEVKKKTPPPQTHTVNPHVRAFVKLMHST